MSHDPISDLHALWHVVEGFIAALVAAGLGRLMWHVGQVSKGSRRFWSLELVWEIPLAIGMAVVGRGLAEFLDLSGNIEAALIAILAYLGPRSAEHILTAWLDRKK